MQNHFLLWATGRDRPGIVAGVTQVLFHCGCNIQDSSMMRLGSEFGVLVIFTTRKNISAEMLRKKFFSLGNHLQLTLGLKAITSKQAQFQAPRQPLITVSVHGADHPGIVAKVTQLLARYKFNITDLSTHRTTQGKQAGFILFIEGEWQKKTAIKKLEQALLRLGKELGTKITVHPVTPHAL